jgi:hypothetical protein
MKTWKDVIYYNNIIIRPASIFANFIVHLNTKYGTQLNANFYITKYENAMTKSTTTSTKQLTTKLFREDLRIEQHEPQLKPWVNPVTLYWVSSTCSTILYMTVERTVIRTVDMYRWNLGSLPVFTRGQWCSSYYEFSVLSFCFICFHSLSCAHCNLWLWICHCWLSLLYLVPNVTCDSGFVIVDCPFFILCPMLPVTLDLSLFITIFNNKTCNTLYAGDDNTICT